MKKDDVKITIPPDDGGEENKQSVFSLDIPTYTTIRMRKDFTFIRIECPEAEQEWQETVGGAAAPSLLTTSGVEQKLKLEKDAPLRYEVCRRIGEGSTANVYSAYDRNINRSTAVKVFKWSANTHDPESVKRFLKEAATLGKLEHPGIVPIYDLDVDDRGRLFMTMRQVEGESLKEYIDKRVRGEQSKRIQSVDDLLQIFIKVAEALAYAHSCETVHQDVKPENILVGDYGQVFLIDWGAVSSGEDEVALTPAYMSPQQANAMDATAQDDIYCLGSTMLHALTLRFPTHAESYEQLWEKRQDGIVDPPTPAECTRIPAAILDVVMKAVEKNPVDRYQTIQELSRDLKNFRAGLSVSAHTDTAPERLERFVRHNKKAIAATFLCLAIGIPALSFFVQDKLKDAVYWGKPVYKETFDSDDWKSDWLPVYGEFAVVDGRLTADTGVRFMTVYHRVLENQAAVEFDGVMPADALPCDLSVAWIESDGENDSVEDLQAAKRYLLQAGAFSNSFSMISRKSACLSYSDFTLHPGQRYRIRAEVDNKTMRLFVDGRKIMEYKSLFAFRAGRIGFYTYFRGKHFDNVRIYSKTLPERVPVMYAGDTLLNNGHYEEAAREYARIHHSHHTKPVGDEALYKQGLCYYKQGMKFGHSNYMGSLCY